MYSFNEHICHFIRTFKTSSGSQQKLQMTMLPFLHLNLYPVGGTLLNSLRKIKTFAPDMADISIVHIHTNSKWV